MHTLLTLHLETMPTTAGTLKALSAHISAHQQQMDGELLDYFGLVRSMLRDELGKLARRRATMQELSHRAYNLDSIIASRPGCLSSELVTAA